MTTLVAELRSIHTKLNYANANNNARSGATLMINFNWEKIWRNCRYYGIRDLIGSLALFMGAELEYRREDY